MSHNASINSSNPESRSSYPESRVPNPEVAISVRNLTKIYKLYDSPQVRLKEALSPFGKKYHKDFYALNDVSFEIKRGETVGIIGQNGAGKSTLLKIITGVITPTNGSVSVNGRISALLELGAGFNPDISGLENVYFNGTLIGFSKEEMDAKLDDILSFADIGDFIHQPVKVYSSGMFVRLAFAVAVHVDPEILIIDEALAVGDVMFQSKSFDKIKSLMKDGMTTLFVTHNMNNIATLCNHAYMLDGGTLFAEGNPKDVALIYYELQRKREHEHQEDAKRRSSQQAENTESRKTREFRSSRSEAESRFGNQAAEVVDFRIYDQEGNEAQALETGKRFKIDMDVLFHDDVENPAVGVMFRNPQGQNLLGIHSYLERRIPIDRKGKGDRFTATFESEMLLNPGKYTLSLGIADHMTEFDFQSVDVRNNVAAIEVYGKQFSYGLVHNPGTVTINLEG